MSTPPRYDAVIAGGGHNGLVAAAYLARAGLRVLVLERRAEVGGAAVSERPFSGHDARLSRYAYLVGLFPDRIARDLGVTVELRRRAVAAYADGLVVDDPPASDRTRASFVAVTGSERDHAAWLEFHAMIGEAARRLSATFTEPLPSAGAVRELLAGVPGAWEALTGRPLGETLHERFAHPLVRGVVGTDGLIGTFASLHDASLRQNRCFLWHVAGGAWRVPVGGMGRLTAALADSAHAAGADVRTRAEVEWIDGGEVTWTEDGHEHAVSADWVLACVAPTELARLRGRETPEVAEGSQTKVNLLLERLPRLRTGVPAAEAFAGTFRLHEREDELEAAYRVAAAGGLPEHPPAELYCHSLTDPSILGADARAGRHTLTLFGLHTPASLFRAEPAATKAVLADRYLDALDAHLDEPIRGCLARDADGAPCLEVKSPLDLEAELGLPGGNIFHGDLSWPWTAAGGGWGVETDEERLLVCGASALRGGGVSGIAGHNAAMRVLGR